MTGSLVALGGPLVWVTPLIIKGSLIESAKQADVSRKPRKTGLDFKNRDELRV